MDRRIVKLKDVTVFKRSYAEVIASCPICGHLENHIVYNTTGQYTKVCYACMGRFLLEVQK